MWSNNIQNNILCEYNNFMLYEKHLTLLNGGRRLMKKKLQGRMLKTLKALAFLEHIAGEKQMRIGSKFMNLKNGLSLLDMKNRISYEWYVRIKLPLRNAIKG